MKKRKLIIIVLIISALFFILKRKIELARAPVFGKRPVLVSVFYSQKRDIKSFREYLAKIKPISKANVSTRISATVEKIFVDEGDLAVPGKPLFIVEDRSRFKLAFDVPQEDIPFLKRGLPIFYEVNNKLKQAKITNIFPSVSPGKILHIEAYLDDKSGIYAGAFVPVKVVTAEEKYVC